MNHWQQQFSTQLQPEHQPMSFGMMIYRNNVYSGLISALQDSFPVIQWLLGDECFRHYARFYLEHDWPSNPVLARLGKSFPSFIRQQIELSDYPYLHEVASIEYEYNQVFHAKEVSALDFQEWLVQIGDFSELENKHLNFLPSVRCFSFDTATCSIWLAHQEAAVDLSFDLLQPESGLLFRHHQKMFLLPLQSADGLCLNAFKLMSVGKAMTMTAEQFPDWSLPEFLQNLAALPLFCVEK